MRLVVNDTSCLIDLRKAGFLQAMFLLPYAFQIALPLVREELLDFTKAEIEDLVGRGLTIVDLSSDLVRQTKHILVFRLLPNRSMITAAAGLNQPFAVCWEGAIQSHEELGRFGSFKSMFLAQSSFSFPRSLDIRIFKAGASRLTKTILQS